MTAVLFVSQKDEFFPNFQLLILGLVTRLITVELRRAPTSNISLKPTQSPSQKKFSDFGSNNLTLACLSSSLNTIVEVLALFATGRDRVIVSISIKK